MNEILSQKQIDQLLEGFHSGAEDFKSTPQTSSVKAYDFKSPKKFTKEQLRVIDSMHDSLSRALSSYFSGILRSYCEVSVDRIEEQRYFEFNNALADAALLALMEMVPVDHNIDPSTLVVDMSTNIGFFMIDRLLGGSGDGYDLKRGFTEIELALLRYVFTNMTPYIQEVWGSYIDLGVEFNSIETNSRLVQVNAYDDIVVVVVMDVKVKNFSGKLSFCIPAINLEAMMAVFNSKYQRMTKKIDVTKETFRRQIIMDALYNSELELKAQLDHLQLDLQDILQLQVDDVIPLSKGINSNIQVTVDDVPWFEAKLGETRLKKAFKINKLM